MEHTYVPIKELGVSYNLYRSAGDNKREENKHES